MNAGAGPLRIGILGAARISGRAIVAPARATGHRLVAVAARDRSRAEAFAAEHGVERVLDSYAELIADPEIEVVYNPLVNAVHAHWNIAALRAGKHVLTEKPSASNAEEAADVRDVARSASVDGGGDRGAGKRDTIFMEGFHYLFHPLTKRLHELLGSGELGELREVETVVSIPAPAPENPRWSLDLAGGALMDLGCYGLHAQRMLARWAGGEPAVVGARGGLRDGTGVDEWLDAELAFPSGATGSARCHMAAREPRMSCRITGSRGEVTAHNFVLPQQDDRLVTRSRAGTRTETPGGKTSYTCQWEAFASAVREGTPSPLGAEDALATMTMIDACYRAAGFAPRPRLRRPTER